MIGATLNALGILLGGLLGLWPRPLLGLPFQRFFKTVLGIVTLLCGLQLLWEDLGPGFTRSLKHLALLLLALVVGFWTGRLLRLQNLSNRLGNHAGKLILRAQKQPPGSPAQGCLVGTLLFCAAPLAFLGSAADGFAGYWPLLALKAAMDALATQSFVKLFGWPAALAALPVFAFLTGLSLAARSLAGGILSDPNQIQPLMAATGLVTCILPLVVFEIRRVELANYLPTLGLAPLLARWLGWN